MFEGKVAIVTGGATGIGAATSLRLAAQGAQVIVTSNQSHEALDAYCTALRDQGFAANPFRCDVTDPVSVSALFAHVQTCHGRLDVLVNCAGVSFLIPLEAMPEAAIKTCLDVNLLGPMLTTRLALPLMRAGGGGAIVNVASGAAILGVIGMSVYAATKAGLAQFTRTLAPELAGSGIRINSVGPGSTRTEMLGFTGAPLTDEQQAALARRAAGTTSPYGNPLIEPDDIARVIVFAVSDEARALHGSFLLADQGVTAAIRPPASA